MFVGRQEQIHQLNSFYESESCQVAAVYGSIGIGKTTLLKEYAKDKPSIFYTAYETTDTAQLALFAKILGLSKVSSIEEVFDEITELAKGDKVLLVMDQYPNFVKADASFEAALYRYITEVWTDLPVKVVLCGDGYLSMEKAVYGKKGIYRGKLALQMELRALSYFESKEFFPRASAEDLAFLYGISGGIPCLLARMTEEPKESVKRLFFDTDALTEVWPRRIMAMELREMSYYNRMLETMAAGNDRVNVISSLIDKPKDVVVPYLNTLMSIGMVEKNHAITEATNRKKTRYSIVNPHVLFYYRFIVPHMELFYEGDFDGLWEEFIETELEDYMKVVFISICEEYLQQASDLSQMPFVVEETGNWWKNDDETGESEGFDLVALGHTEGKSATAFCQCYYTKEPIEIATLKGLIEKTKQLRPQGDVFYLVFSQNGFHENAITVSSAVKNILLITLEDIHLLKN